MKRSHMQVCKLIYVFKNTPMVLPSFTHASSDITGTVVVLSVLRPSTRVRMGQKCRHTPILNVSESNPNVKVLLCVSAD